MTDLLALEAVRLISANLRRAVADGSNMEAREQMMMGSIGRDGLQAGLGAVHAIAMAMGGFGVTHGKTPFCFRAVMSSTEQSRNLPVWPPSARRSGHERP